MFVSPKIRPNFDASFEDLILFNHPRWEYLVFGLSVIFVFLELVYFFIILQNLFQFLFKLEVGSNSKLVVSTKKSFQAHLTKATRLLRYPLSSFHNVNALFGFSRSLTYLIYYKVFF